jgi:DNA-binding transcriptional MerR regulator
MQFAPRSIAADDADRVFTTRDVSRIAPSSLRQLQWWDERKLISPRQEGHRRVYLPEQVIEIMVVAELRRKGLALQKIRRVVRFLRREMVQRMSAVASNESRLYLLTDGKSIYLEAESQRVIDLLKNARQPESRSEQQHLARLIHPVRTAQDLRRLFWHWLGFFRFPFRKRCRRQKYRLPTLFHPPFAL